MSYVHRPSWDDIWMGVAEYLAGRSLCYRAAVGAVIVDTDWRVVSTGYNGPPAGFDHRGLSCASWCPRGKATASGVFDAAAKAATCVAVHAEANALLSGDRSRWVGGTMLCIKHPCWDCCKLIANSGLMHLQVRPLEKATHEHEARYRWLRDCGIEVRIWET